MLKCCRLLNRTLVLPAFAYAERCAATQAMRRAFWLREVDMKKFRFTALLLCLAVLCCALLALAACNAPDPSGQSGSTGEEDPPAEKTVSVADVYDANVNEDGLAADITLAKQQKILSSIAGAENVNYLTDRTAIVEMADGTSHLFDITAAFSAEDKSFLENIADAIYAAANLDPHATITEAQEQATIQALKAAARQFAADAEQIIQNVSVDFVQLPQIDQSVELRENISEFTGFEQVVFSQMTESMAFTAEGNLESENCTMSYAFGINLDSSITAFVVTYADNGETAQEKIDNLANPGAAIISEVGTFPAGVDFTSQLPQLVQREEQISFENAYKQVFGNFVYSDVTTQLKNLTSQVLATAELLFADFNDQGLTLYAHVDRAGNARYDGLGTMTYRGNSFEQIKTFLTLLQNIDEIGFSQTVEEIYKSEIANGNESVIAALNNLKSQLEAGEQLLASVPVRDFTIRSPISNTSTNINFAEFAKQFIPNGTEPVFCYVGSFGLGNMESKDNPYFNTGYYNQCRVVVGYIDSNNAMTIEKLYIVVPQYLDSTNETMYQSVLGVENVDYKIVSSGSSTEIFNNPILTGATSGIKAEAAAEATR